MPALNFRRSKNSFHATSVTYDNYTLLWREKAMMSINLDRDTERYLVTILAQENTTSSELIERLLREYWDSIQPKKNFLERLLSI
jgi:hypothetical protein